MQIVTTTNIEKKYLERLKNYVDCVICCNNHEEAEQHLGNTDIIISDHVNFTLGTLRNAPKLKWVQLVTAGVDVLPLDAIGERGVILTNNRGVHKYQMSEYAFAMILNHARRLDHYKELQKNNKWEAGFIGNDLYKQAVGIIGTGSIGMEIAKKAKAFEMKVIGINQNGEGREFFDSCIKFSGIDSILKECDYIVLTVPLTPETNHMIRYEHFQKMKNSCYFINISRGSVVEESEMIKALQNKEIGGAALDVFKFEPLVSDSPLWGMENITITPHHAGVSTEYYFDRTFDLICENIERFIEGKLLKNTVDTKKGY